jgi:hypothetical protein
MLVNKDFLDAAKQEQLPESNAPLSPAAPSHAIPKRLAKLAAGVFAALMLPSLGVVTVFGIAPGTSTESIEQTQVSKALEISADAIAHQAGVMHTYVFQERIQRGDTLAALMSRLNATDASAFQFLTRDASAKGFLTLKPGRVMVATVDGAKQISKLRYFQSPNSVLELTRGEQGFSVQERVINESPRTVIKSGVITFSLFGATDAAGVPDSIATELAKIFSTDIDFYVDLRKGDRFSVAPAALLPRSFRTRASSTQRFSIRTLTVQTRTSLQMERTVRAASCAHQSNLHASVRALVDAFIQSSNSGAPTRVPILPLLSAPKS